MNKTTKIIIGILVVMLAVLAILTLGRSTTEPVEENNENVATSTETVTNVSTSTVATTTPTATTTKPVVKAPAKPAPVGLDGLSFRLASYGATTTPPSSNFTLSFKSGSINARFCNMLGGAYSLSANTIKANLFGTLMYCDVQDVMEIENTFGNMLRSGATYTLKGSTLSLTDKKGYTLVFSPVTN